jgi:hypothetical protein
MERAKSIILATGKANDLGINGILLDFKFIV